MLIIITFLNPLCGPEGHYTTPPAVLVQLWRVVYPGCRIICSIIAPEFLPNRKNSGLGLTLRQYVKSVLLSGRVYNRTWWGFLQ